MYLFEVSPTHPYPTPYFVDLVISRIMATPSIACIGIIGKHVFVHSFHCID